MAKAKKTTKKKAAAQKKAKKSSAVKAKAKVSAKKAAPKKKASVKTTKAKTKKVAPKAASKVTKVKKAAAPAVEVPVTETPKAQPKVKKAAAPIKETITLEDEIAQYEEIKKKSPEEMEELRELLGEVDAEDEVEIALRDAEGRLYCKMRECDELATVDGYCRYHYIKLWKKIQLRKKILTDGKLEKYIEELTLRYPDKYIEMIRADLRSEKHFLAAIQELEIDDVNDEPIDSDDDQGLMDEVRGLQTAGDGDDDSF